MISTILHSNAGLHSLWHLSRAGIAWPRLLPPTAYAASKPPCWQPGHIAPCLAHGPLRLQVTSTTHLTFRLDLLSLDHLSR